MTDKPTFRLNNPTKRDPPSRKPPLDYVPLDHVTAPPLAHTRTTYASPALRRAATAAGVTGVTLGALFFLPVWAAIPALAAFWWAVCRLYAR